MKIILNNSSEKTISIDEITDKYLVVAIIEGLPCILRKGFYEENKSLSFGVINILFTSGNGYSYTEEDTVKKMIESSIRVHNAKVEAFPQSQWKEALQWLIDNAE